MGADFQNRSNKDRRSGHDRRSEPRYEQRDVAEFLRGHKVRFAHPPDLATALSKPAEVNHNDWKESADRRFGSERRSSRGRRCGFDSRSEVEQFLQGERRSGLDRRSKDGYRSFKKARAFTRSLELKSVQEWQDYIEADLKPDDIPDTPHQFYANDGWAGWGDWLGTSAAATS